MAERDENRVALLSAEGGATIQTVQTKIDSLWAELKDSPEVRQLAAKEGVPPTFFEGTKPAPFAAGQPDAQILETGVILIIVGKAALGWATKKGLDVLWDRFIWPKLEEDFPDLQVKDRYGC
jgi:hypothetical protein